MQLVQIGKMIQENSKQFNEDKIESPYKIESMAFYCGSVKGYILTVKLDGVLFNISSQREERRVFKSIDTMTKTLKDIGVHNISICI